MNLNSPLTPGANRRSPAKPALTISAAGRNNTIGLAERELLELIDILDEAEQAWDRNPRRDFARWPFRQIGLEVSVVHPGGTEATIRLACRNISRGGIAVLHRGFLYPGTLCRVRLPRLDGTSADLPGKVCRCQHRRGTLHEVGIKFNKPLNLKLYVKPKDHRSFHILESVNPASVKGRLLLVEHCALTTQILCHQLRETAVEVTTVTSATEALARAGEGFSVIVLAVAFPDMDCTAFIKSIRADGNETPALVLTSDPYKKPSCDAGFLADVGFLIKPLNQGLVLRTIADRLVSQSNP